jgi:hypothetical protein
MATNDYKLNKTSGDTYEVWSRDGGMLLGSMELWTDEWLIEGDPDEIGYANPAAAARALVNHWREIHGEASS